MTNLPKISIIVPVYNVEPYMERCLLSVMRQTYTGPLECIIVDDCGTDNSIGIAERLITEYKGPIQFQILHHEHNRGLSAARNTGTDAVTGDYIYYLDSDDELMPMCIAQMVKQVVLHPGVQCVQGTTLSTIGCNNISCFASLPYINDNAQIRNTFYGLTNSLPVNAWDKLIQTQVLKEHHLYFKEGILHEDRHWMFYIVKYLNSIAFCFDPTYIYYRRPDSIMGTIFIERTAKNYKIILFDWIEHCDEISLLAQVQTILSQYATQKVYIACNKEENSIFLQKVKVKLKSQKQYKSILYLQLWKMFLPIHNFRKLLRLSCESIQIK